VASPFIELEVGDRVVKLTNPDKVLFPKARKTKRDLAEFYVAQLDLTAITRIRLVVDNTSTANAIAVESHVITGDSLG